MPAYDASCPRCGEPATAASERVCCAGCAAYLHAACYAACYAEGCPRCPEQKTLAEVDAERAVRRRQLQARLAWVGGLFVLTYPLAALFGLQAGIASRLLGYEQSSWGLVLLVDLVRLGFLVDIFVTVARLR